jgi:hypothetical protein
MIPCSPLARVGPSRSRCVRSIPFHPVCEVSLVGDEANSKRTVIRHVGGVYCYVKDTSCVRLSDIQ